MKMIRSDLLWAAAVVLGSVPFANAESSLGDAARVLDGDVQVSRVLNLPSYEEARNEFLLKVRDGAIKLTCGTGTHG